MSNREYALGDANRGSGLADMYCDDSTVTFTRQGESRQVGVSVASQTAAGFESTDGFVEFAQDGGVIDVTSGLAPANWVPVLTGTGATLVNADYVRIPLDDTTSLMWIGLEYSVGSGVKSSTFTLPTGYTLAGGQGCGAFANTARGASVNGANNDNVLTVESIDGSLDLGDIRLATVLLVHNPS